LPEGCIYRTRQPADTASIVLSWLPDILAIVLLSEIESAQTIPGRQIQKPQVRLPMDSGFAQGRAPE